MRNRGGGTISAPDLSGSQVSSTKISNPAQYPPGELKCGGRRDNLEGFQRPQWEDVRLDRRLHTREAQAFAGTRELHKSCAALLDTGSPASSIRKKVWNDMPGSGAASSDGEALTQSRTASASVQLNVLLGRKGTISCESSEDTSVRPVVGPHSSPTG